MKQNEKLELNILFRSVIKKFQSRCWICKEKYNENIAFVLHHRKYLSNEKIYSDFKLSNNKPDRLSYYRYLIPIVKLDPNRFRLLHHKHHWMAENWAMSRPARFERTVIVAREINKRKFNGDNK